MGGNKKSLYTPAVVAEDICIVENIFTIRLHASGVSDARKRHLGQILQTSPPFWPKCSHVLTHLSSLYTFVKLVELDRLFRNMTYLLLNIGQLLTNICGFGRHDKCWSTCCRNDCQHLRNLWVRSGVKVHQSCRSRKKLQNDFLGPNIGFDVSDNERPHVAHHNCISTVIGFLLHSPESRIGTCTHEDGSGRVKFT